MAYIEPKTTWTASNIPVASDLNRIEGNTEYNHDEIVAEISARIADVNAEEAARIAADSAEVTARNNAITSAVNAEASTRSGADSSLQSQISALYVAGGVGSYAFLKNITASTVMTPGGDYSGSTLRYSDAFPHTGGEPSGTWRCMGYCVNGTASLFVRVS